MKQDAPHFEVRLANSPADLEAAQRLRYDVFVQELGAGGADVDHQAGLERDRFDAFSDHLLVHDPNKDRLAGVYRLMRQDQARAAGQFYSEDEYDLSVLIDSGRRLLELGRSCLHPDYRGGAAMFYLWQGLADYIADHDIEILFGVASFHGIEPGPLAAPLSLLHHRHLAPPDLRVQAKGADALRMDTIPLPDLDRKAAMLAMPALIKAYLRLGGVVGEGAFIDRVFNTTDICLILDTARMNSAQRRLYDRRAEA